MAKVDSVETLHSAAVLARAATLRWQRLNAAQGTASRLDFTSALYLGLWHRSETLRPWMQLTSGVPQALRAPPRAERVAQRVAELQGCERGTLGSSTLHLFWDVCGLLTKRPCTIFEDAGVYPIARWGVERAAARGAVVRRFAHYDAGVLRRCMHETRGRPIIVACGFCPGCGRHAPIPEYLAIVRERRGLLIVDDTQALGIFGQQVRANAPFGSGGGGSLQWYGVRDPNILLISSLAKGFGVPVAVMAGCQQAVEQFERESETRVHCSPPAAANIHAVEHALDVNQSSGDALRLRLARRVHHFRNQLTHYGLNATGGMFPVQTLRGVAGDEAVRLHARLQQRNIQTVLHQGQHTHTARLSIILNARHRAEAINHLTRALVEGIHNELNQAKRWR